MPSPYPFTPQELTLRDVLAIERTKMANERTLLAYTRTGFVLLVSGGTLLKLFQKGFWIPFTGCCFLSISIVVMGCGFYRFWKEHKQLKGYLAIPEELAHLAKPNKALTESTSPRRQ